MNKYRNKKVAGFDSKGEKDRYQELQLMERAGEIRDLRRQVKFVLIPTQREPPTIGPRGALKPGPVIERECSYYADFVYYKELSGELVVEDHKGVRTKEYVIKRKLMLQRYGVKIYET